MPDIVIGPKLYEDAPRHKVFTRERWAGEWVERQYLYCDYCEFLASPEIGRAQFTWRYGFGLQPGTFAYAAFEPLALGNHFVKVEIENADNPDSPSVWYGVILSDTRQPHGGFDAGGQPLPQGDQILHAFDLGYLLTRVTITSSYIHHATDPYAIQRAIGFNLGAGDLRDTGFQDTARMGNRSEAILPLGVGAPYGFSTDANGKVWTGHQVIEYLLYFFTPRLPGEAQPEVRFRVDPEVVNPIDRTLDWFTPTMDVQGMSVKQVLDELLNRRRIMSYTIVVRTDDFGPDQVYLRPFTFTHQDIQLDDFAAAPSIYSLFQGDATNTVPANPNLVTLDVDASSHVIQPILRADYSAQYDQVIIQGARRTGTFTVSFAAGTILAAWDTSPDFSELTEYENWDDLDPAEKEYLIVMHASQEKYRRWLAWYKIGGQTLGSGRANNGTDDGEFLPIVPVLDANGAPTNAVVPFWQRGIRLMRQLPLVIDRDYTGSKIADGEVSGGTDSAEYVRPLVWLKIPLTDIAQEEDDPISAPESYQLVDTLADPEATIRPTSTSWYSTRPWSCSVRILEEIPGFELRVNGAPQNVLGDGSIGLQPISNQNLLATVAAEWDEHVEIKWPPDAQLDPNKPPLILYIPMPSARLDWVVPGTVVATDGVGQRVESTGGFVRDDRQRMLRVAKIAHAWYSTPRQAFEFSIRGILRDVRVGDLITRVGPAEGGAAVNTVVTRVMWDLVRGTTSINTGFAELDLGSMVGT